MPGHGSPRSFEGRQHEARAGVRFAAGDLAFLARTRPTCAITTAKSIRLCSTAQNRVPGSRIAAPKLAKIALWSGSTRGTARSQAGTEDRARSRESAPRSARVSGGRHDNRHHAGNERHPPKPRVKVRTSSQSRTLSERRKGRRRDGQRAESRRDGNRRAGQLGGTKGQGEMWRAGEK
jgi:hypothetical protein